MRRCMLLQYLECYFSSSSSFASVVATIAAVFRIYNSSANSACFCRERRRNRIPLPQSRTPASDNYADEFELDEEEGDVSIAG